MSTPGPDDPESTPPPAPELGGLDPQDLLQAGLETVPQVTLPQQPSDPDATIPVSKPQPSQPSAAQPELPLPEQLTELLPHGMYRVESFLGQGGMGAVYKGQQVRLKRPVAIKIMRRDFGKDYDFEARFEREAQAMAKLNHPNIVSVIDYGEAGPDYLYIVMELVDGADMMDVIRTGRMTQEMALTLLPQICDALQFAHDHGIVHRDIKPSNIMLTRDGRIKMADFGLAKRFDAESSFRTQTGTGMGTPDYAAPEQFDAQAPIDHRADIYALGVMIYQMITGTLPRGVWKPPSQRAEIDPHWDDIVSRAMQSDPKDRYQQANEVKTDVSSIPLPRSRDIPVASRTLAGSAPQAPRPGNRNVSAPSKSRAPLIFGLIAGALVIAIGAFFALRDSMVGQGSLRGSATSLPGSATEMVAPPSSPASAPQASAQSVQNTPSAARPSPASAGGSGSKERQFTADERKKIDEAWQKNRNSDFDLISNEPAAHGSAWQPLFAETEWRASEGTNRVFRDGWLHLTGHAITKTRVPSAEGKIRTKVRIAPGTAAPAIVLRDGQTESRLEVILDSKGTCVEFRVAKGTTGSTVPPKTQVSDKRATAFQDIRDYAVIEISLSGSSLSASLTGSGNARAGVRMTDEQLARVSEWGIGATDAWFESVEVQPLPAAAASPSPNLAVPKSSTTPATATKDAPFVNSLGMKFVPVPIGGGPTKDQRVLFGVWDVRVQDYAAYAAANPKADGSWKTQNKDGVPVGREPDHPVVGVSWEDAQAFCQWLTAKETAEGKLPPGMKYRLPSDEEWSWAVGLPPEQGATPEEKRGNNKQEHPWGRTWPPAGIVGNYADQAFHAKFPPRSDAKTGRMENDVWLDAYTDGYETTSPVGQFPPNVNGLYDMGGNVWQWCEDWINQDQKTRVLRGASFVTGDRGALLSSHRYHARATDRAFVYGFRCVLAASAPASSAVTPTPATATKDVPFTNTLGMKFVPVPITGGPTDKQRVLFSVWDVRVRDFETFVTESGYDMDRGEKMHSWHEGKYGQFGESWRSPGFKQTAEHPVVGMSWEDAKAFCQWLTKRERAAARIGENQEYRLPTDHEWSCAVGIGDREEPKASPKDKNGKLKDVFPWGTQWPPPKGVGNYGDASAKKVHPTWSTIDGYDDGFAATSPVGTFPANQYGLFDMGGNVWQWCEDPWESGARGRVIRGGSFGYFVGSDLLSSCRSDPSPTSRVVNFGFRCVLAPFASAQAATKDAPFMNTLGMKFVPVPITGGPTDKQHVLFSIWETRVQDYEVFVKETKREWPKPDFEQGPTHPAVLVNWDDATVFCAWLTDRERKMAKLGANEGYRLPSDHEWSCAVGIGDKENATDSPVAKGNRMKDVYPWGGVWPPANSAGNYFGAECASAPMPERSPIAGFDDGFVRTAPVGSFQPSPLGLFDLGGNIMEWCADWFDPEKENRRVLRGGAWSRDKPIYTKSSWRDYNVPADRVPVNGFRVVRAPVPAAATPGK